MSNVERVYWRHLPHWQPDGATIFITWRLYGSLPKEALDRLEEERQALERRGPPPGGSILDFRVRQQKHLVVRADAMLAGSTASPHWLKEKRIASLVTEALFFSFWTAL
jgi:hypothetical protein